MGAEVYVTGRDEQRGLDAERRLRGLAGHARVHFVRADASTVGGNQQLARHFLETTERLHVLVNNIGGLSNDRRTSADGYEATLAMNFVGPFALTQALLSLLERSAPARIVNVVSSAYAMWTGDPFADLQSEGRYLGRREYARAELLNVLWTLALARWLEGSGVVANAASPGTAWTATTRELAPRAMPVAQRLFWPLFRLVQRRGSPERTARAPIFLASAREAGCLSGVYVESDARPVQPPAAALDRASQERAWEIGTSLVAGAPTGERGGAAVSGWGIVSSCPREELRSAS
jgi:NAD(P)-dependent dehydrogenase (short-subunit alcohol dehydrogenase family)